MTKEKLQYYIRAEGFTPDEAESITRDFRHGLRILNALRQSRQGTQKVSNDASTQFSKNRQIMKTWERSPQLKLDLKNIPK